MNRTSAIALAILTLAAGATWGAAPARATPAPATSVQAFENQVQGTVFDLTPEDVVPTGSGDLAVGSTESPQSVLVNWLLRLDATGRPRWAEELGCLDLPPGDYTIGVSAAPTADGGTVLAGGTVGCGAPSTTQRALVERLDPSGQVSWARNYEAGPDGSALTQIRQTADGGFVAAGNATDAQGNTGGLVLRLDPSGTIVWQRTFGPSGSDQAYLYGVEPTADGGAIAVGNLSQPGPNGLPITSVLVLKLDAAGNLQWRRTLNSVDGGGSLTAQEQVHSVLQAPDGGYLVAGYWLSSPGPGQCCTGALLLKLDPSGRLSWQRAYSGGLYCVGGECDPVGAFVSSMRREPNGQYLLAGDGDVELIGGGTQLVPWMAEVDGRGDLLWQQLYYEVYAPTGRPLSEYFASAATARGSGAVAVGYTEDYVSQHGELYVVRTDASGAVPGCGDVSPAPALTPIDPGLVPIPATLPVGVAVASGAAAPVTTMPTSVLDQHECG